MCVQRAQDKGLVLLYTIYTYNNVYLIGIVLVFRCSDGERMECGDVETWNVETWDKSKELSVGPWDPLLLLVVLPD